jgi:hypothetical protein
MQGWRISMEDAHANILDLQAHTEGGKPTEADKRLAYFGVYDGHGGDKVAIFTGERLHDIVTKQEAYKSGDLKKALQDGFLAADRAILSGTCPSSWSRCRTPLTRGRSQVRGGGVWLHRDRCRCVKRQDLLREHIQAYIQCAIAYARRPTLATREPSLV